LRMSTRIYESAILHAPIQKVWDAIRPLDFKFLPTVVAVSHDSKSSNGSTVNSFRTIEYNDKDKTKQQIHVVELSDSQTFVTFDLTASTPNVSYSGATHTIRLRAVTTKNRTFIEFTSDYSKDAGKDVIFDSMYKKHDFFVALAAVTESRARKFVRGLDFSKFALSTSKQVEEAWAAFDTDKNGSLDQQEIGKLVEALVGRIDEEQNSVQKALQSLFAEPSKKDEKSESKESKETKIDAAKTAKSVSAAMLKRVKHLTRECIGRLDKNRDGKIDWNEFKMLFPAWLNEKIEEGLEAALIY